MRKTLLLVVAILLLVSLQAEADLTLIGQGTSANGTWNLIYDSDLDITWYDYTNAIDIWQNQVDWADALSVNFGENVYDDWRLPVTFDQNCYGYNCTNSEMGNLYYTGLGNSAGDLSYTGDFQNLVSSNYWSGSEFTIKGDYWVFVTLKGYQAHGWAGSKRLGIAVRPGLAVMNDGNASTSTVCPSGLIAYWNFDEGEGSKVYDSVGDNDGDIWGGGGTRIEGVVGNALELDGVDDWVNIKFDDLDGANAFTIIFWVLPERLPFDDYHALFWKGPMRKASPYILGNAGSSTMWISVDTTAMDNDGDFTTANQLLQNQWNQIAVTWDGTNIYAYINGVKDPSTDTTVGNVLVANQYLRLGYAWGSLFDGSLDEYAVFNRSLSAPEIQRHYQNNLNGMGYCEEVKNMACVGFEYPMDSGPVAVKKNKVLPLRAQFLDADGNMVTDLDLASAPVIQVSYDSCIEGDAVDVTDDIRSDRKGRKGRNGMKGGKGTKGNQFVFTNDSNWQFNLNTKSYTAKGTYTISIVTGDDVEYGIVPTCEATFIVE